MSPGTKWWNRKSACRHGSECFEGVPGLPARQLCPHRGQCARWGSYFRRSQIIVNPVEGLWFTAVNAIASAYGIDKVFTVSKAKSNYYLAHYDDGKLPDDDGGEICELLGLPCIRLNRRAFAEEFNEEYLYYCALHHNQDANLKDISKHVSKVSLLLTGTLEGDIWYPKASGQEGSFWMRT